MTDVKPRVVAVIPCYNTAPHIAEVVTKVRQYVDQVIVVDDGSTDATAEIARAAGAEVVSHKRNLGYGEVIKTCFREAQKNGNDILVTIDGDGQHDPRQIPQVILPILTAKADMVIGSRFLGNKQTVPRYRRFGIKAITWLWNFGSEVKVSDTQSGFRAYSKKMFDDLPVSESGMSVSVEILENARQKNANIAEIPISCHYVVNGIHSGAIIHGVSLAISVIRIRISSMMKSSSSPRL